MVMIINKYKCTNHSMTTEQIGRWPVYLKCLWGMDKHIV